MNKCWCGNEELEEYSTDYFMCKKCQTLVSKASFDDMIYTIKDEENDLYGKNYWEKTMMEEAGVDSLDDIIDLYLRERAIYWLRYLFKYLPFSCSVAEIGCGLGQLPYMMKQLGYDQMAYELSPDICKFVRKELGINIVSTPFEEVEDKYDSVLAFDVVEHILEPQAFIENCVKRLKEEGILCIQTPCYDEQLSYDGMSHMKPRFQELLVKDQHIYLYSKSSIIELLKAAGLEYVQFEPAFFGDDYDMFLFASKRPFNQNTEAEIDSYLNSVENGRLVKAMMTLFDEKNKIERLYQQADKDRNDRLNSINILEAQLKESESDRNNRLSQIEEYAELVKENNIRIKTSEEEKEKLGSLLKTSEQDRAERLKQINELTEMLKNSEEDRQARLEQINKLTEMLKNSEEDRQARFEQIQQLTKLINDMKIRINK